MTMKTKYGNCPQSHSRKFLHKLDAHGCTKIMYASSMKTHTQSAKYILFLLLFGWFGTIVLKKPMLSQSNLYGETILHKNHTPTSNQYLLGLVSNPIQHSVLQLVTQRLRQKHFRASLAHVLKVLKTNFLELPE